MRRKLVVSLVVILVVSFGGLLADLIAGNEPALGLDLQGGISVTQQPVGRVRPGRARPRRRADPRARRQPRRRRARDPPPGRRHRRQPARREEPAGGRSTSCRSPVRCTCGPCRAASTKVSRPPRRRPTHRPPPPSGPATSSDVSTDGHHGHALRRPARPDRWAPRPPTRPPRLRPPRLRPAPTRPPRSPVTPRRPAPPPSSARPPCPARRPCPATRSPPSHGGQVRPHAAADPAAARAAGSASSARPAGPARCSRTTRRRHHRRWLGRHRRPARRRRGRRRLERARHAVLQPRPDGCPSGQLAIELDGEIISAPSVNEPVFSGDVPITGTFSEGEAEDLARVLNSGSLPVEHGDRSRSRTCRRRSARTRCMRRSSPASSAWRSCCSC